MKNKIKEKQRETTSKGKCIYKESCKIKRGDMQVCQSMEETGMILNSLLA